MINYLKTFFKEKYLPTIQWEIIDDNGCTHFISNEVVVEAISAASTDFQKDVAQIIRKIDFINGNVNHYLKHLAVELINA